MMTDSHMTPHHMMYTPRTPVRRAESSQIEDGDACADVVDALAYYFENSSGMDIGLEVSEVASCVKSQIVFTWKLFIELFRMEALNERLGDQNSSSSMLDDDSSSSVLREGFQKFPQFRRLLGILRWCHWRNIQSVPRGYKSGVSPSEEAYPASSPGVELDGSIFFSEKISASDIQREHLLLRELWQLLSQGRVAAAMDLCTSAGHHWRAGVLNAACGHEGIRDNQPTDIDPDWVESEVSSVVFGHCSSETSPARWALKHTAQGLVTQQKTKIGIDEFDSGFIGYLCGDVEAMGEAERKDLLWLRLHALKEQFAARLMGGKGRLVGVFESVPEDALNEVLFAQIKEVVDEVFEKEDDFQVLQNACIIGDYAEAIGIATQKWISQGTVDVVSCVGLKKISANVDLFSSSVDAVALVLVRSFLCSFTTIVSDLVVRRKLEAGSLVATADIQSAVVANVDCLIAQYRSSGELVAVANGVIVDTIGLLPKSDDTTVELWAKYFEGIEVSREWDSQTVVNFPPLLSLLEGYSELAVHVLRLLVDRPKISSRRMVFVANIVHAFWLLAQSAAKSSGNGIYSDIVGIEAPEEAVIVLVGDLNRLMGRLVVELLHGGDLEAAKAVLAAANHTNGKLIALAAASEAADDINDQLGIAREIVAAFERANVVKERQSLLEQQHAHLTLIAGRATGTKPGVMSTDARRQTLEIKRLIDSTAEMINRFNNEMVAALVELLKTERFGIDNGCSKAVVTDVIDNLFEMCTEAVCVSDDAKQQDRLVAEFRTHEWLRMTAAPGLIKTIMTQKQQPLDNNRL